MHVRLALMLTVALTACFPEDERDKAQDTSTETDVVVDTDVTDTDAETEGPPSDVDQDGVTAEDGDCDDANPTIHPGAEEMTADGLDQDCDGGDLCFADADRDGAGSSMTIGSTNLSCAEPGESATADDCDDLAPLVHPGAQEDVADGVDQNCDGGDTCFMDADEDGSGDLLTASSSDLDCLDQGEAAIADDCDDGEDRAFPGNREVCDGVDNDCDLTADEDAADAAIFYADTDNDGFGDPGAAVPLCYLLAGFVSDDSDCFDGSADAFPGQTDHFGVDRGDGSYDYDCDGKEQTSLGQQVYSCKVGYLAAPGWLNSVPACGTIGTFRSNVDPADCSFTSKQETAMCR